MIKKLTLKNFQIHKNTTLEFCNGVNVLAGTSDGGKSSIIRALQWAIQNKPSGALAYRNSKCKKNDCVEVAIEFDNNVLTRKRSESINEYTLNGTPFVAMRTDVPEEINSLLDITDINILNQFDPFYLLSASSGEVSKELNSICNLAIIDKVIKLSKSVVTDSKDKAKIAKEQLDVVQNKLSLLSNIDQQKVDLEAIIQENKKRDDILQKKKTLSKLVSDLQNTDQVITSYKALAKHSKQIKNLNELALEAETKTANLRQLEALINQVATIDSRLTKLPKKVSLDIFNAIDQMIIQHKGDKERCDLLFSLARDAVKVTKELTAQNMIIEELTVELNEIMKDIDICPFCDREIIHG